MKDYVQMLESIMFYEGKQPPEYFEGYRLEAFDPHDMDNGDYVDYIDEYHYPNIFLTIRNDGNDKWFVGNAQIGILEDSYHTASEDKNIIAAYVLQSLGIIEDVVELIDVGYYDEPEDYLGTFIPSMDRSEGTVLIFKNNDIDFEKFNEVLAGEMAISNTEYAKKAYELYTEMDEKEKNAINSFLNVYSSFSVERAINMATKK